MTEVPRRFDGLRRWSGAAVVLGAVAALSLIAVGALELSRGAAELTRWPMYIFIATGVIVLAMFAGIWAALSLMIKIESNSFRSYDALRELQAQGAESGANLQTIAESVQLSEVAKSISHRGKERTVLRLAINEEIIRGDWEAAYALVEQLEARHGYKNEATRLRAELDGSRDLTRQHAVHDAVEQVNAHMDAHDWDRARREMDDLLSRQPDHPEIKTLPEKFKKLRSEHKRRLLKTWDEAVQRNDVDRGITTLKELDQYLTPNEAAALMESARGVFQAKLHNYGVQFSLAVTEHDWPQALHIGRQIMDEYPNSRMAQEVRDRIHILAKRAEDRAEEGVPQA